MSRELDHDAMAELVAAYSLDAVDADEARLVEDHLRDCPRCRAELAENRETAAMLGYSGNDAPEGVWDRIAGELTPSPPAPGLRLVVGGLSDAPPVRRRVTRIVAAGAVAAVAAVVAVMGVSLVRTEHRVSQVDVALAQSRVLEQATAAALNPAASRVALVSNSGGVLADAVVLPDGSAYVLPAGLRALAPSRTYQMWSITGGRPVSAGLLGPDPQVHAFRVARGAKVIAITDEPAGGSPQPTSAPVASASI